MSLVVTFGNALCVFVEKSEIIAKMERKFRKVCFGYGLCISYTASVISHVQSSPRHSELGLDISQNCYQKFVTFVTFVPIIEKGKFVTFGPIE